MRQIFKASINAISPQPTVIVDIHRMDEHGMEVYLGAVAINTLTNEWENDTFDQMGHITEAERASMEMVLAMMLAARADRGLSWIIFEAPIV